MKPEWRRFAPVGLYLALVALVVSVGLYLIQREWNLWLQISLGLIVVGLAVYAILDPNRVRMALTGRQARYGSNALILTLAFLGILIVINYLIYQNSKRWDLTEDKQYTLAKETIDTLQSLEEPVEAQAFFSQRRSTDQARSLLEQYAFNSDGKFSYSFIDPESQPVLAEQAKVTRDGTIVLLMGENQQQVTVVSEQELTGGLVRLMNPEQSTVYFLTGHGEHSPEETGDQSYSQVKTALEGKNYAVKTLNLLATNQIPEDAKLVIIAGPQKPLSSAEVDLLSLYLANGGAIIVMEDPLPVTQFEDAPDPLADYLTQTWGVTLGKDFVIDTNSNQLSFAIGAQWGSHAIASQLGQFVAVFPTARSVSVGSAPDGVSQSTIVSTIAQAWGESDLAAIEAQSMEIRPDEGVDVIGPVPLAVAAENFDTKGRIVVFGDADFAIDVNFPAYGNGDLIVNSVDWAIGQENLISLTPKDTTQRLIVPPQKVQMNLLMVGTVIVLPGLALLAGIVVWIQRRRRG